MFYLISRYSNQLVNTRPISYYWSKRFLKSPTLTLSSPNFSKLHCFPPKSLKTSNLSQTSSSTFSSSSSSTLSQQSVPCWNCQKVQPTEKENIIKFPPTCSYCNSLQDIETSSIDYFQLLMTNTKDNNDTDKSPTKMKNPYQIDMMKITSSAKELQKKLHPDLYSNKDKKEQELSDKLSSFVNHALATLQNPIERGIYLFKQQYGETIDMESQLTLDTAFLGQVMELNEKLLELSNQEEWTKFRNENNEQLQKLEKNLAKAFDTNDVKEIKLILSKMKYYDNLQGKLKEQQFKLGFVE